MYIKLPLNELFKMDHLRTMIILLLAGIISIFPNMLLGKHYSKTTMGLIFFISFCFLWIVVSGVAEIEKYYKNLKKEKEKIIRKIYIDHGLDLLIEKIENLCFVYKCAVSGKSFKPVTVDEQSLNSLINKIFLKLFNDNVVIKEAVKKLNDYQEQLLKDSVKDNDYYRKCKILNFFLYDIKNYLLKLKIKDKNKIESITLANDSKFLDKYDAVWFELQDFAHLKEAQQ